MHIAKTYDETTIGSAPLLDRLAWFAAQIIGQSFSDGGGDVDEWFIEEKAEAAGLVTAHKVTTGDIAAGKLADVSNADELEPGDTYYRIIPELEPMVDAA